MGCRYLVTSGISEAGEQGEELPTSWRGSVVLEYDGIELGGGGDFIGVAHQSLGNCVDGVEDRQFSDSGAS